MDARNRNSRGRGGKFRKGPQFVRKPKTKKWEKENVLIAQKTALYSLDLDKNALFADFPLSAQTLRGLRRYLPDAEKAKPTQIQRATLLPALQGKDILAAAKTGSGKTLGEGS